MSHEVETMFYAGAVPWHGLGNKVPAHLNSAAALKAAGLDWQVGLKPIYTADMKEIPGFLAVTREKDGSVYGVVTPQYRPIQNREVFDFGEAILSTNEAVWETAGSLYGGARVWILGKLPKALKIAGDKVEPYFLLTNGHDGKSSMIAQLTPVRVVCQNTLNMALRGKNRQAKISHRHNYEQQLGEAKRLLGFVSDYYTSFADFADKLVRQKFTERAFESLVKDLLPDIQVKDGKDTPGTKAAQTRVEGEREKVLVAYKRPDIDNIRHTKFGAYNAIADYADHDRALRGDPKDRKVAERRWIRTFENTDLKDRALEILTEA